MQQFCCKAGYLSASWLLLLLQRKAVGLRQRQRLQVCGNKSKPQKQYLAAYLIYR